MWRKGDGQRQWRLVEKRRQKRLGNKAAELTAVRSLRCLRRRGRTRTHLTTPSPSVASSQLFTLTTVGVIPVTLTAENGSVADVGLVAVGLQAELLPREL